MAALIGLRALVDDPAERRALLQLRLLDGLGDQRLRRLLRRHGSASAALRAPDAELGASAAAMRDDPVLPGRLDAIERTLDAGDVVILTDEDAAYPAELRARLTCPPLLLYCRGDVSLLRRRIAAIVGSRQATDYGTAMARLLARGVARADVVVMSGMARGVDGAAHVGALEAGTTIGMLGCGIDVVYPFEHRALCQEVARRGLLLTEEEPGAPPIGGHFKRRNRVIGALAEITVVVEAKHKSGALNTAAWAQTTARTVGAVPGPATRPQSLGTNGLLRDGAHVITTPEDILELMGISVVEVADRLRDAPPPGVRGAARTLWAILDREPRGVDELSDRACLTSAGALAALLELELAGAARQVPGRRFMRA